MADYDVFANFYDSVMGDRAATTQFLQNLIQTSNPQAEKILELACGTGSVLKLLAKSYQVFGLDLSKSMLALAKRKVPQATLYRRDMITFHLRERFDAILCVFDSINHVLRFSDWRRVFANCYRHLNVGGVFIFDINTQRKLARHIAEPTWVHKFGKNFLLMDVTDAGHGISNWNIIVFEWTGSRQYRLHEENIKEVSFPAKVVRKALWEFGSVKVIDTDRKRPSEKSERLYFVCTKK